jgi:hypothetical protein
MIDQASGKRLGNLASEISSIALHFMDRAICPLGL